MRADFDVLIDACVLANHGVCDLLLSLAERPRLFVPHWTAKILHEVERTHFEKLGWPANLVELFQREIATAFPEAEIHGYEGFIEGLTNDWKDRHVLAAAICGGLKTMLNVGFWILDFEWWIGGFDKAKDMCDHFASNPSNVGWTSVGGGGEKI